MKWHSFYKRKEKDTRINAPLISFRSYLIILCTMFILIVGQAFILSEWLNQPATLIGVLTYYMLFLCLVLAILWGVVRQRFYGNPLRKIAKAARQIAEGDYSVKMPPLRKDGKKDEFEVLIEDFNRMAEQLGSVEMLKSDFIANVSHEIKSPLSIIQSYTKALKDPTMTVKQHDQYVDTILTATQNLNTMISNILKLNKLQHQEIPLAAKEYQLGEQLRRCSLDFIEKWQEKHITFHIDVQDIVIHYDASLLELVWNNLISNAIKFTQCGGKIFLTSYVKGDMVYVSIKDTGRGIPEEAMTRIFDKFYQVDISHSGEGNGLGLALVKRIIEIVHGKITVQSKENEGTEFIVSLKI